jgi:tRNA(fMet)-specific endonuclease VapC
MYPLDTDTLSHLHLGHPRVVERLRQVADPEARTTIVTKIEILRARYEFLLKAADGDQLLRAQEWLERSEHLLSRLTIVPFDHAAATQFERLRRVKKLKPIGRADLLIASIALARDATLVTRNLRHFQQIPGMRLENWVD